MKLKKIEIKKILTIEKNVMYINKKMNCKKKFPLNGWFLPIQRREYFCFVLIFPQLSYSIMLCIHLKKIVCNVFLLLAQYSFEKTRTQVSIFFQFLLFFCLFCTFFSYIFIRAEREGFYHSLVARKAVDSLFLDAALSSPFVAWGWITLNNIERLL